MVQIYQNEELNDIMFEVEALDEWKNLTAELGMEKQLGFVTKAESPLPYPFINESMDRIFTTLCPRKVDFKEYDKTPIPLEVLKQISFSMKEKHFNSISVWYDDKSPDPFVVGLSTKYYCYDRSYKHLQGEDKKDVLFDSEKEAKEYAQVVGFDYYGTSTSFRHEYLIARWGDEIRPIPELKELAKGRLLEKYGAELKNEIEEKSQALKKINENVTLFLSGEITESKLKGGQW